MKKLPQYFLIGGGLLLMSALRAEEAAKAAPPPPEDLTMIADLRTQTSAIFQYGTWDGKVAVSKAAGLVVLGAKGAQGAGGFGHDIGSELDFTAVKYVEVALGVVPGNEVPQITIALNDADGTQFTARITIDQIVPGTPVWLRAQRADFKLNAGEKGKDGEMDWSKVTHWHLQGDWNTKKPCAVAFLALRTRK